MATTRQYRQALRAEQAEANTGRIVSSAVELIKKVRRTADITLDDVSRESGVTVRTILRRFGSRDGVLEAAFGQIKTEFKGYRKATAPGDVPAAIKALLNQYEVIGELNMRALAQEDQLPLLHRALNEARQSHRAWLGDVFGPLLKRLSSKERESCLNALYAATDVYLWKLLRRDLKLDRAATEATFTRLVEGICTTF